MNPSANGWIKKLLKELTIQNGFLKQDPDGLYKALRRCGFIYGSSVGCLRRQYNALDLSEEEFAKLNLVLSLLYIHNNFKGKKDDFTVSVVAFYKSINAFKTSFLDDLLGGKKGHEQLEKIVHKRIHLDDNLITKNFNYFITNAVLFSDVLAYQSFLKGYIPAETYLKQLESTIETGVYKAFEVKQDKTDYDHSLMQLFASSLRYKTDKPKPLKDLLPNLSLKLEKYYFLDTITMAMWTDKIIDTKEQHFLDSVTESLQLPQNEVKDAILDLNAFYTENKEKVALFNAKNPVQNFYDNTGKMVNKLISRNKKRLIKELQQSKELMQLLSKSTLQPLTEEEQKKVQNQLLDIFKTIPSLAIFMLPGGAILLPIVIKFIPQLLPSAFDDNRV